MYRPLSSQEVLDYAAELEVHLFWRRLLAYVQERIAESDNPSRQVFKLTLDTSYEYDDEGNTDHELSDIIANCVDLEGKPAADFFTGEDELEHDLLMDQQFVTLPDTLYDESEPEYNLFDEPALKFNTLFVVVEDPPVLVDLKE